jgi:hypothetical protein
MRFIVTKCKLDHAYLAAMHGKVDCDKERYLNVTKVERSTHVTQVVSEIREHSQLRL